MGASGADKTTLLDVIAGRKTGGVRKGTITLNGHEVEKETFSAMLRRTASRWICTTSSPPSPRRWSSPLRSPGRRGTRRGQTHSCPRRWTSSSCARSPGTRSAPRAPPTASPRPTESSHRRGRARVQRARFLPRRAHLRFRLPRGAHRHVGGAQGGEDGPHRDLHHSPALHGDLPHVR